MNDMQRPKWADLRTLCGSHQTIPLPTWPPSREIWMALSSRVVCGGPGRENSAALRGRIAEPGEKARIFEITSLRWDDAIVYEEKS